MDPTEDEKCVVYGDGSGNSVTGQARIQQTESHPGLSTANTTSSSQSNSFYHNLEAPPATLSMPASSTPRQSLDYSYDAGSKLYSFAINDSTSMPGGDIGGGEGLIDPMYTLTAVAFQMAPVALREAEGGGGLTQEFVIVPHGTSPIGSGSTGDEAAAGLQDNVNISNPDTELLPPKSKKRPSKKRKSRLCGNGTVKTKLSRMAKSKFDDEPLDLVCEWLLRNTRHGDICNFHTGDIKEFMSHVSGHVERDLPIEFNLNIVENGPGEGEGGEERSGRNDEYDDEETENASDNKDYICQWRGCNHQSPSSGEIVRHVHFHSFHTKLKSHGRYVAKETGLESCQLDPRQANIIPDLSEPLVCLWQAESCLGEGTTFSEPLKFYWHTQWHAEEYRGESNHSSLKCLWKDCTAEAKTVSKLKEHLRVHSQEKLIACPVCGALFANRTKFVDHCKRQVSSDLPPNSAGMNQEEQSTQTTTLKCSYCSKRFATERLLRDHMRAHINQFKCPLCDMTCAKPSSLVAHINYKHFQVKAYSCPKKGCDYKAKAENDIHRHYRTHINEETYVCPFEGCSYTAKARANVKNHIEKEHEKSGPKYLCHLCPEDRRFARGNYLTNHLVNVHKLRWPNGHCRFRYKRDDESGLYSLQTMRFESVDLVQKSISGNEPGDNDNMEDQNRSEPLFEDDESVIMEEITKQVVGQETAD